jgi:hypothetical protein
MLRVLKRRHWPSRPILTLAKRQQVPQISPVISLVKQLQAILQVGQRIQPMAKMERVLRTKIP